MFFYDDNRRKRQCVFLAVLALLVSFLVIPAGRRCGALSNVSARRRFSAGRLVEACAGAQEGTGWRGDYHRLFRRLDHGGARRRKCTGLLCLAGVQVVV